jgi:hypothetical protein
MISETLHPIKKATALTRALAVASNKMNTTIVLGDTLASRPRTARMITVLMGCPGVRPGALSAAVGPSARTGRTTR